MAISSLPPSLPPRIGASTERAGQARAGRPATAADAVEAVRPGSPTGHATAEERRQAVPDSKALQALEARLSDAAEARARERVTQTMAPARQARLAVATYQEVGRFRSPEPDAGGVIDNLDLHA